MVIRPLLESDRDALLIFCNECAELGWKNNQDFDAIKLDKIKMPYGQYFVATENNKIFSFAGVHKFPEIDNTAWRCLFRGAQLPRYAPSWSMNIFNSGIHFSYFLYEQIKFIQEIDPKAEFYITTNIDNESAGASSRLNKIMMPRLEGKGYVSLAKENFMLYNTLQNVWKVNIDNYMLARNKFIGE